MAVQVKWLPSPESDVASYVLEWSSTVLGPWAVRATVPNDQTGNYYDAADGLFSYPDSDGNELTWYRLKAIDTAQLVSDPSEPFRAVATPPEYGNSQVKVDHDYPEQGRLSYVTESGVGVDGAIIRAFRASDYDESNNVPPVATTITHLGGRWKDSMYLTPGYTYVIVYAKEGSYGPDSSRIDV